MNPSQAIIVAENSASTTAAAAAVKEDAKEECLVISEESGGDDHEEDCGRERLKRHRVEMAGRVWIPEIWGQESCLKDWIDCAAFDASLVPKGLLLAREALVRDCRRANSGGLQIENPC